MNGAIGAALLAMSHARTRDEAQPWAQEAAHRGATPEELAAAWAAWDALEAKSVQEVGSGTAAAVNTTDPSIALLAMANSGSHEEAEHWARRAELRGASPEQIAAAWRDWNDPSPAPGAGIRCKCSHAPHPGRSCWSVACGCRVSRPEEITR